MLCSREVLCLYAWAVAAIEVLQGAFTNHVCWHCEWMNTDAHNTYIEKFVTGFSQALISVWLLKITFCKGILHLLNISLHQTSLLITSLEPSTCFHPLCKKSDDNFYAYMWFGNTSYKTSICTLAKEQQQSMILPLQARWICQMAWYGTS